MKIVKLTEAKEVISYYECYDVYTIVQVSSYLLTNI